MNDAHGKVDSHSVRCPICDQDHVLELTCLQVWLAKLKTESQGYLTNVPNTMSSATDHQEGLLKVAVFEESAADYFYEVL